MNPGFHVDTVANIAVKPVKAGLSIDRLLLLATWYPRV